MRSLLAAILPALVLSTACTDLAEVEEDPIDGSFPDGKADGSGVAEGSSQALGILNLVNEASATSLRDRIGVSARATNSIIGARAGGDGQLLTEDDQIIWSLEELDELPYVGARTLETLDDFSHDEGYYDENNHRAVLYSYGTSTARSRLYLNDDGTGYVEDEIRGAAGLYERATIDGVPHELVVQLRDQIAAALTAEHEREDLPGSTTEPEGTLTVYLWDGTASVIDSYEHTSSGYAHIANVAESADEIRATIGSLVRVRMPNMPE